MSKHFRILKEERFDKKDKEYIYLVQSKELWFFWDTITGYFDFEDAKRYLEELKFKPKRSVMVECKI